MIHNINTLYYTLLLIIRKQFLNLDQKKKNKKMVLMYDKIVELY